MSKAVALPFAIMQNACAGVFTSMACQFRFSTRTVDLYKTSFMPSPQPFDLSVARLRLIYASKFHNCLANPCRTAHAPRNDKSQMTNDKQLSLGLSYRASGKKSVICHSMRCTCDYHTHPQGHAIRPYTI